MASVFFDKPAGWSIDWEITSTAQHKVDALQAAGWSAEVSTRNLEPWQWSWRRPPRRKGSTGRLYRSTDQAYNALLRES